MNSHDQSQMTSATVAAGDVRGVMPEFGRCQDLQRLFGLKRGSAYNLLAAGKIRGCVIRIKGQKSGVRLFDMDSVRQFIRAEMAGGKAV